MQARTLRPFAPQLPRSARMLLATLSVAVVACFAQNAMAQPMGPHGGMGPGPDMGMGIGMGGPMQDRILDSVNATADQRAQIKAITQAALADLKAQRDAGRSLHEQSAALFTASTVDARAAEALRQQMLAQFDASSKRTLQAMLDASRVLTADQRKTLGDRMAARKALMARQRAERAALEKSSTGK